MPSHKIFRSTEAGRAMNSIRPKLRTQTQGRKIIAHYVAILLPSEVGEWRVVFPDVSGCETRGFTVQDATIAAVSALARSAEEQGQRFPRPRSLLEIENDGNWLSTKLDLSRAIVTIVPLFSRIGPFSVSHSLAHRSHGRAMIIDHR